MEWELQALTGSGVGWIGDDRDWDELAGDKSRKNTEIWWRAEKDGHVKGVGGCMSEKGEGGGMKEGLTESEV